MSPRARPLASVLTGISLVFTALVFSGDASGAKAGTFTIDYPPLGFKVAIAYPEEGQLCIIVPESAQDPAACLGLDPAAMTQALPEGPDRPFGVAYARMGEWSYIVMLAPIGSGIEAKEDIEEFVSAAAKPDPDLPDVLPKLVGPSPERTYEIVQIKETPVVKFRLDAGVPPGSPSYEVSTMLHYAAFGGKTAMVSFITNPKDVDRVTPYAEATVQSLVLPRREAPARFGKPRAELAATSPGKAIGLLVALVALGTLLFAWIGRGKKVEDEKPARPKTSRRAKAKAVEPEPEADEADESEAGDAEDGKES